MYKEKLFVLAAILCCAQLSAQHQKGKTDSLQIIISELAANDVYERSLTVGYAGSASKQIQLFERLVQYAPERELAKLALHNKNAVVRLYGFQALKRKIESIPGNISKKFQTDTTEVTALSGCIAERKRVKNLAFEPVIKAHVSSACGER